MTDNDITDRIAEILAPQLFNQDAEIARQRGAGRDTDWEHVHPSTRAYWKHMARAAAEVLSRDLGLTEFSQPDQITRCWITKRWLKDED